MEFGKLLLFKLIHIHVLLVMISFVFLFRNREETVSYLCTGFGSFR